MEPSLVSLHRFYFTTCISYLPRVPINKILLENSLQRAVKLCSTHVSLHVFSVGHGTAHIARIVLQTATRGKKLQRTVTKFCHAEIISGNIKYIFAFSTISQRQCFLLSEVQYFKVYCRYLKYLKTGFISDP